MAMSKRSGLFFGFGGGFFFGRFFPVPKTDCP